MAEFTRDALATLIRDWIHEQPFSQCDAGADTCPDWPMAYDLADHILAEEEEVTALCAECDMPMRVVFRHKTVVRVFKVCKCKTKAEELVRR